MTWPIQSHVSIREDREREFEFLQKRQRLMLADVGEAPCLVVGEAHPTSRVVCHVIIAAVHEDAGGEPLPLHVHPQM